MELEAGAEIVGVSRSEEPVADSESSMKSQKLAARIRAGFTRVETAMVLVLICSLTALVIPIAKRELVFAHGATAYSQTEEVARAITMVLKDTRMPPIEGGYGTFLGDGTPPANLKATKPLSTGAFASKEAPPSFSGSILGIWKGPYLGAVRPDPWGNAIVVTSMGDPELYIWCVSAGPNGILETTEHDRLAKGDDVATRVY